MSRRVAVITGASSGIGRETARALAARGWRIIGIGRNPERCEQARQRIVEGSEDADLVSIICADLALMSEVQRAAEEIRMLTNQVDVLINNAGGVTAQLKITSEGNENTFASNHLGHFLLTNALLPLLKNSVADTSTGTTRIINVSSTGHESTDGLDWDDLQSINSFSCGGAYCRAKLANILFTRELAKRLASEGIAAHAMHPGVVHTNFVNHADTAMKAYMATLESQTPEEAADTLIWLATAEEPGKTSGQYFHQRTSIPTSAAGRDDLAAERLWKESEKLIAQSLNR